MKQTVRHGLGIALSAMAFLYAIIPPWVRERGVRCRMR